LRSPAGGSHAPPAALGRCLGGGRGESIPCLRELWVVVVGSSRAHAAADTRAEGGWGVRSVRRRHGLQRGPVGVECQQRHEHGKQCVRPRLRHVPRCPRVCPQPGEGTLLPQLLSPAFGGAWGRLASAGVRCPTVGLEPPTTRSGRSAATGVWMSRPSRRAWGGGWLIAVFYGATAFNGDLSAWNVSSVLDMAQSACGPASATSPACPRLRSQAGGSHAPPAAAERCLRMGRRGGVRLRPACAVPPWGSHPRPQDRSAALPRACGCAAPQGVRGAWGACAQCSGTPRPSTGTCRRGMLATSRA
jgi:surface protein